MDLGVSRLARSIRQTAYITETRRHMRHMKLAAIVAARRCRPPCAVGQRAA